MTREEVEIEGIPIVDLEVEDDRFPGRVFVGTVESVIKQMEQLKPGLFDNATVVPELSSSDSVLEKRQSVSVCPRV